MVADSGSDIRNEMAESADREWTFYNRGGYSFANRWKFTVFNE